jgi:FkbM family methyltransferase
MSMASTWGLVRSLVIYYGQPWKVGRMNRFYRQFIAPGDLCFDVGAHVGNRVRSWLSLGAKVIAIEPQPSMVAALERFYGSNPAVTICPVGVSDAAGDLTLFVNVRNPTLTTFSKEWVDDFEGDPGLGAAPWDHEFTVPVTTLEALIAEHGTPVFCKIDVEGLEPQVLAGLQTPIPALSFEAFPLHNERSVACVRRIAALGDYRFRFVHAESFRWMQDEWLDAESMAQFLESRTLSDGSGDVYAALA